MFAGIKIYPIFVEQNTNNMTTTIKRTRPADYDNSWLGVTVTIAQLWEGKKMIGTCIDSPNAVAYAKSIRPSITKAVGICGKYDMKDVNSRIWFAAKDQNLSKMLKFNS